LGRFFSLKAGLEFFRGPDTFDSMNLKLISRALAVALAVFAGQLSSPPVYGQESIAELAAAAKKNNPDAQFKLGLAYELGTGVAPSAEDAVSWYRKAARANHAKAQLALGFCYANGVGVKNDWKEAAKLFRQAADGGLPEAAHKAGFCFLRGQGVTANEAEAFKYFSKAAEAGILEAQLQVGEMYYTGAGVGQSYPDSFRWFLKAAERGLPEAQYRVGSFYLLGQGGAPKDMVEAHKWLVLALPLGRDDPNKLRDKMATLYRMTPEQIADSFKRAKAFKAVP
jgi:TPR repeat protein